MKKCLFFLFLFIGLSLQAQSLMRPGEKAFNFGLKAGGTSVLPVITSFYLGDDEVGNVQLHYKVGYTLEMFGRVNIDRFFLQPSFVWSYSKGAVLFTLPSGDGTSAKAVTSSSGSQYDFGVRALEVPLLVGYNLVKEGPYALSMMIGGKFRYNYDTNYESRNTSYEYVDDHTPYYFSSLAGVSVSVGRLFFDANYEFGLREVRSTFAIPVSSASPGLSMKKRINAINVSFGFIF